MTIPANCTQIIPVHIQSTTATTPNGVVTSILVLGEDNNLYITLYQVPSLNPNAVSVQPWTRLPPIIINNDFVDYPFPNPTNGNVINFPYSPFNIQGQ